MDAAPSSAEHSKAEPSKADLRAAALAARDALGDRKREAAAAKVAKRGLPILGLFRGMQLASVAPEEMSIAITPAIRKLMKHHKLANADVDLWELHEAYAVTTLYNQAQLETPWETTNVNGGADAAIALRPWASPKIYNSIFTDFNERGVLLDTQNGVIATQAGGMVRIQVKGAVQSGGWKHARLQLTRGDGNMLVVEFLAQPPASGAVIAGLLPVSAAITARLPRGVVAVRAQAEANEVTAQILH